MAHWLDEYPVLRRMPRQISAADYNRIRLGLMRHRPSRRQPWQLPLPAFRCLLGVLDESAWVCVDGCQNDMPIIAWTNFVTRRRSALDAPVECELRLYHMHAGLVMGSALEALAVAVAGHGQRQHAQSQPVSRLRR